MAKKDAISRRKKRRLETNTVEVSSFRTYSSMYTQVIIPFAPLLHFLQDDKSSDTTASKLSKLQEMTNAVDVEKDTRVVSSVGDDGIANLEEMFGLGADQLRELEDIELPVPREDLVTGKVVIQEDKDKVFKLPDLAEYMEETGGKSIRDKDKRGMGQAEAMIADEDKIDRSNMDEYRRVLKFNPYADADDEMFAEQVITFDKKFPTLCYALDVYLHFSVISCIVRYFPSNFWHWRTIGRADTFLAVWSYDLSAHNAIVCLRVFSG